MSARKNHELTGSVGLIEFRQLNLTAWRLRKEDGSLGPRLSDAWLVLSVAHFLAGVVEDAEDGLKTVNECSGCITKSHMAKETPMTETEWKESGKEWEEDVLRNVLGGRRQERLTKSETRLGPYDIVYFEELQVSKQEGRLL